MKAALYSMDHTSLLAFKERKLVHVHVGTSLFVFISCDLLLGNTSSQI